MILFHGQRWDDDQLERLRGNLAGACLETLAGPPLLPETVVAACEALASRMARGDYDPVLRPLLAALGVEESQFAAALRLFTRESLERKLTVELGDAPTDLPHPPFAPIHRQRRGLGVLLHIAAGNVDGLPAYSVVEGLLAGNINILKLPAADRGVSLLLLEELTRIEPRLADFIYVFDTPSTDLASLEVFARAADAVVVWGGDEAVRSARQLAQPDTQIISWGHKLSFAYAVPDATQEDLAALARHICLTRQLLCSSCQGIFVDTADLAEAEELGERFFQLLRSENRRASPRGPGPAGQGRPPAVHRLSGGGQGRPAGAAGGRRQRHRRAGLPAGTEPSGRQLLGKAPAQDAAGSHAAAHEGPSADGGATLPPGRAGAAV